MIRIAIVDDQPQEMERIRSLAEGLKDSLHRPVEIRTFGSAFDVLEYIEENGGFDLYLLDILLPHMTGIELAERLRKRRERAEIVFLTTSREYGVDAFGVEAAGYLIKPVSAADFSERCTRIIARLTASSRPPVLVRTGGGVHKVSADEIVMIESFNHYREVRLCDGQILLTSTTLSVFGDMLKGYKEFYSPHRAYIVNLDYVTGIQGGDLYISDVVVPVARNAQKKFREYYIAYSFGK